MSVYLLEITSFRGISIGAQHFYGKIRSAWWNSEERKWNADITYTIENYHQEKMVKYYQECNGFTEKEALEEAIWNFPVGYESSRFFDKEYLISSSIEFFNENMNPTEDLLIHWNDIYHFNSQKDKILAGSSTLIAKINEFEKDIDKENFIRTIV